MPSGRTLLLRMRYSIFCIEKIYFHSWSIQSRISSSTLLDIRLWMDACFYGGWTWSMNLAVLKLGNKVKIANAEVGWINFCTESFVCVNRSVFMLTYQGNQVPHGTIFSHVCEHAVGWAKASVLGMGMAPVHTALFALVSGFHHVSLLVWCLSVWARAPHFQVKLNTTCW